MAIYKYKNMSIKYVASIQHTGTWFIIDFLKYYLGNKFNLIITKYLTNEANELDTDKTNIILTHIISYHTKNNDWKELRKYIPNELKILKENKDILIPFLKNNGYKYLS